MLDRLYRALLVLFAAIAGGLVLYWASPDVKPYIGENGAAAWSWFLIVASGVAAHIALPRSDLTVVSNILFAVVVSAATAVFCTAVAAFLLDFPGDDGVLWLYALAGAAAIVMAALVYIPVYLLSRKFRRPLYAVYVALGASVPALWVFVFRPFGDDRIELITIEALILGAIGASSAIAFSLVAGRSR